MGLIRGFLPAACAGCGRYGSVLCRDCRARFRPPVRPADLFFAADAGAVVGEDLVVALAAFSHGGAVRHVLQRLKYGHARAVASELAVELEPALERLLAICGPAVLSPVPVHRSRLRQRGYNQADLLASALARRSGLPARRLLIRATPTIRQHGLSRDARLVNLAHAFVARSTSMPPRVIVVDDIVTSAATLEACARALRAGGVREVYGLCVAREV